MKSYMRLTGREVKKEKKKRQERSVESGRASEVIERTIGCFHPREVVVLCLTLCDPSGTPLQYSCLENPMDRRAW